jgi:hypothetical protein
MEPSRTASLMAMGQLTDVVTDLKHIAEQGKLVPGILIVPDALLTAQHDLSLTKFVDDIQENQLASHHVDTPDTPIEYDWRRILVLNLVVKRIQELCHGDSIGRGLDARIELSVERVFALLIRGKGGQPMPLE